MSGTVEEVLLQNEDLLFSAAGVRCVIGMERSAGFEGVRKYNSCSRKKCWPCVTLAQMYSTSTASSTTVPVLYH